MRAKIYAPTIEQRREALKVAERFRPKVWLIRLGLYPTLLLFYAWFKAGLTFPFEFDALDLGIFLFIATGVEIYQFATKTDKAKLHAFLQDEDSSELGPLQYRLSEAGFEWCQHGDHELQRWDRFEKFKLTDGLLILVLPDGGYWVVSRDEIGEADLATIVGRLEEQGVREVVGHLSQRLARYSLPLIVVSDGAKAKP